MSNTQKLTVDDLRKAGIKKPTNNGILGIPVPTELHGYYIGAGNKKRVLVIIEDSYDHDYGYVIVAVKNKTVTTIAVGASFSTVEDAEKRGLPEAERAEPQMMVNGRDPTDDGVAAEAMLDNLYRIVESVNDPSLKGGAF